MNLQNYKNVCSKANWIKPDFQKSKNSECVHCKSENIICLKINIIKPPSFKKYKCVDCLKTFLCKK